MRHPIGGLRKETALSQRRLVRTELLSYENAAITSGFAGYVDDTNYTFGSNVWTFNYNDTVAGLNYGTDATADGQDKFVTLTAFTVVPEPGTALLGALGVLALLRRRR